MQSGPIETSDIERLGLADAPDLADAILAFLEQLDPEPRAHDAGDDSTENEATTGAIDVSTKTTNDESDDESDDDEAATPAPTREGTLSLEAFQALRDDAARRRKRSERSEAARAAWQRFLTQTDPPPPPRFQLADLLVRIYERGTEPGRAALVRLAAEAPLVHGVFGGLKRIYKLAEARYDGELFGVLAARFDRESSGRPSRWVRRDASRATLVYLAHRAWRFLRQLGAAVPALYPTFAVEVLRRYGEGVEVEALWIPKGVFFHGASATASASARKGKASKRKKARRVVETDVLKGRAFDAAWKLAPEPLLYLAETCAAETPARFAIAALRKDFPEVLRKPPIAWLDRLARRPLGALHELVVEILTTSPELHPSKLRALGLHDAVLALLSSPSDKARRYAMDHARANASELDTERLLELIENAPPDTVAFAAQVLTARPPRTLGTALLGRMLTFDATSKWAGEQLETAFDRAEISHDFLADMLFGDDDQHRWTRKYIAKKYPQGAIGAAFWMRVLDDRRQTDGYAATEAALEALGKLPVSAIDPGWLMTALIRDGIGESVGEWLQKADKLPAIDIERLKGLVFHPSYRSVALTVLGNAKLIKPRDLGLGWLLALARRADPALHAFAHRLLLEHMKPQDFDDRGERGDRAAGTARLFALAAGDKEPEPVRVFAQTYLRCHHPTLGPEQPEAKELSLKPALDRAAYTAERVWPMLLDGRADVRKFALVIAKAELRAWGYQTRVYELGDSDAKEVRGLAYAPLLQAGEPTADAACTLTPEELDAGRVFAMTESGKRPSRETAMELVRRHYARLGGAERLGWLMQSADREVRQFAVRLLWEKHRPRALPAGYKPPKALASPIEMAGSFDDAEALRSLLRRTLFALPPGRAKEASDAGAPRRRLPASEVKRNVVEIVRDLALADATFAGFVAPILLEMSGSVAKGEWHACLSALARLRRAHGVALGGT